MGIISSLSFSYCSDPSTVQSQNRSRIYGYELLLRRYYNAEVGSLLPALLKILRKLYVYLFLHFNYKTQKYQKKLGIDFYFRQKNQRSSYLVSCDFSGRILKKEGLCLTPQIKLCDAL